MDIIHIKGGRHPSEFSEDKVNKIAQKHLGYSGRLLCGSKSTYRRKYPEHYVLFNANLFTINYGKIWYGDIDLNIDKNKIVKISEQLKETVFLIPEWEGRFDNTKLIDSEIMEKCYWDTIRGFKPKIEKSWKEHIKRIKSKRKKTLFRLKCDKCGNYFYRIGTLLLDINRNDDEYGWYEDVDCYCKCKGWMKVLNVKGE